jgi:hypothetical protein
MNFTVLVQIEVLGYFAVGDKLWLIFEGLPWQSKVLPTNLVYWNNYFHLNKTHFILEDPWQCTTTNVLKYWTYILL